MRFLRSPAPKRTARGQTKATYLPSRPWQQQYPEEHRQEHQKGSEKDRPPCPARSVQQKDRRTICIADSNRTVYMQDRRTMSNVLKETSHSQDALSVL